MRLSSYLLIVATLLSGVAFAEKSEYGDIRGIFISPRFAALGEGAQVISDEPLPIGNPASIQLAKRTNVYLGYNGYYKNLFSVTSAYMTLPIDSVQSVAVSLSYMLIPDIDSVALVEVTPGADPVYEFSTITASEIYIDARYARTMFTTDKLRFILGGAFHAKRKRLGDWTGFGVGADVGIVTEFQRGMRLSWQVNNIITEYTRYSNDSGSLDNYYSENTLPISYLGVGYIKEVTPKFELQLSYRSPDLFANSGVVNSRVGEESLFEEDSTQINPWKKPSQFFTEAGYGVELGIHKTAFIRLGWADTRKLTFGGGAYLFDRLDVDFVYAHSFLLEGTYGVSLRYHF